MKVVYLPGRRLGQVRNAKKEKPFIVSPPEDGCWFVFLLNYFLAFMSHFIFVFYRVVVILY